jgi:Flp pilus assembly protein TadD
MLGHSLEAEREASAALAIRPHDVAAHICLGDALLWLGQLAQAEAHARRAVDLEPFRAEVFATLGVILRTGGHPVEALLQFRQALLLDAALPEKLRERAKQLLAQALPGRAEVLQQVAQWIAQSAREP